MATQKTIDLGRKSDLPNSSIETTQSDSSGEENSTIYYPSLYISDRENLKGIPSAGSTGTATIFYKILSWTESQNDKDIRYSAEIEVQKITFPSSTTKEVDNEFEIEKGLKEAEDEEQED